MIINAKVSDLLNSLVKTQFDDGSLIIRLPESAVYGEKLCITQSHIIIDGNNCTVGGLEINGTDILLRNIKFDASAVLSKQSSDVCFDCCSFVSKNIVDGSDILFLQCGFEGKDFVSGSANADFHDCTFVSSQEGYVCSPSTPKSNESGFFFMDCEFKCSDECPKSSVFLARQSDNPSDSEISPFACFATSKLGSHINERLWPDSLYERRFAIDQQTLDTLTTK